MKKTILLAVFFLFFGLAPHVLAQGFVPLAPIPGLTEGVTANTPGLATFFNNLYKFLIGLAAALAVIMIIWGGLEYSTQDSISKKSDGKERIYQAIFGLILVLSPVLVFSIINPSILNLSLNLQPLDTASGPPVGPTGPLPICAASQTTNCTKPICSSYRTTNCIPRTDAVNAVAQGAYATPQSGGWCYQITNCTTSSCVTACGAGGCNYVCGNQTQCTASYSDDYRGNQAGVLSSCSLR